MSIAAQSEDHYVLPTQAAKNEGHDVSRARFHAVVLRSFSHPGKKISVTIGFFIGQTKTILQ